MASTDGIDKEMNFAKALLTEDEFRLLRALKDQPENFDLVIQFAEAQRSGAPTGAGPQGGGGGEGGPNDTGETMTVLDFFSLVIDCAIERWGSESYYVMFNDGDHFHNKAPREKLIKWAKERLSEGTEVTSITVGRKAEYINFEAHEFTAFEADKKFGRGVGDLELLRDLCQKRLCPIEDIKKDGSLVPPKLEYVDFEDPGSAFEIDDNSQGDKSYVVVVTGESGSGKSVLSCLQAQHKSFLPLYLLLSSGSSDEKKKKKDGLGVEAIDISKITKPQSEFPKLHNILAGLLRKRTSDRTNWPAEKALCGIKAKLHVTRNQWAQKVLYTVLHQSLAKDPNAKAWIEKSWKEERLPDKVAIILDGVTDIDLVEGLVKSVKDITMNLKDLVKKQALLVLTGTGLDAIRYPGGVGTNPAYARLIKVHGPAKLDVLQGVLGEEILYAIKHGLFSSVMQTNTRMLFRSVIPNLQNPTLHVDGHSFEPEQKKQRLEVRLKQVADFGPVMDHAARFYVNQNSVGSLSGEDRDDLLKDAFLYHLISALETKMAEKAFKSADKSVQKIGKEALETFKNLRDENQSRSKMQPSTDIFTRGLAARYGTSVALKYLSCFGLTCTLRSGSGQQFEELTALHYMRLLEVQGYPVERKDLNSAWPPKSNKKDKNIKKEDIASLRKTLEEQKRTELMSFAIPPLKKWGVVFRQGTDTAQGGDVLVLVVNPDECLLEVTQCKNYKESNGDKMFSWWWSLGVRHEGGKKWSFEPTEGSAGYSFAGLDAFRELLKEKLGREVKLGDRTMAVSFPMPPKAKFPCPVDKRARVWFREMFEPTVSVFPPKTIE